MGARAGWTTTALAALAVLAVLGVGGGGVAAKVIDCPFATECSGTKKADTIRGVGQNNLFGKGGNDKLRTEGGASVLAGGAGDDQIFALIDGFNIIEGGNGDDAIEARNGEPDTIDCGKGKDSVTFDAALDDIKNCEKKQS